MLLGKPDLEYFPQSRLEQGNIRQKYLMAIWGLREEVSLSGIYRALKVTLPTLIIIKGYIPFRTFTRCNNEDL